MTLEIGLKNQGLKQSREIKYLFSFFWIRDILSSEYPLEKDAEGNATDRPSPIALTLTSQPLSFQPLYTTYLDLSFMTRPAPIGLHSANHIDDVN